MKIFWSRICCKRDFLVACDRLNRALYMPFLLQVSISTVININLVAVWINPNNYNDMNISNVNLSNKVIYSIILFQILFKVSRPTAYLYEQ